MKKVKNGLRTAVVSLMSAIMVLSIVFIGAPVKAHANTIESSHTIDVLGPQSRTPDRQTTVDPTNSAPVSFNLARNTAQPPFNYENRVSITHAGDFHDALIQVNEQTQRLVISLHHFPFDSVILDVLFWHNGQWVPMIAQPIVTTRGSNGFGETFVLNGNLPAGFYLITIDSHPTLFTSANHFNFSVNFTNNFTTNFANDAFHQVRMPGRNASVTNQIITITNQRDPWGMGQDWRLDICIVQSRQSRITGEMYLVLMRNNNQGMRFRTQAEANAYANIIRAGGNNHFAWQMFGANPVIRHTETQPLRP